MEELIQKRARHAFERTVLIAESAWEIKRKETVKMERLNQCSAHLYKRIRAIPHSAGQQTFIYFIRESVNFGTCERQIIHTTERREVT
jgi:hypothetical protein